MRHAAYCLGALLCLMAAAASGFAATSPLSGSGQPGNGPAPVIVQGVLPGCTPGPLCPDGTGTGYPEPFEFQLGVSYDHEGPAHPMLIGYHGFSSSAASVALASTLDEECNQRGWVYLSVTGISQVAFGSPLSQRNTEAAIEWMLDRFNIDPDRLYMVGFSMGGGIATNFAARHRDPDGIMLAGVGTVAGTFDRTLSHAWAPTDFVKRILEFKFNFTGSPRAAPFAYRQASTLSFDQYFPLPGATPSCPPPLVLGTNLVASLSLGSNLEHTPVYLSWNQCDDNKQAQVLNRELVDLLADIGNQEVFNDKHSCLAGNCSNHSWSILDEDELLDFLADKLTTRYPDNFHATLDRDGGVSFVELTQDVSLAFSHIDGMLDDERVTLSGLDNVKTVRVDLGATRNATEILVTAADASGTTLELLGDGALPSYLLDLGAGSLITGTVADPIAGTLAAAIPALRPLGVEVITESSWTSTLQLQFTNETVAGQTLLTVTGSPGEQIASILVGTDEILQWIGPGLPIVVDPVHTLTVPLTHAGVGSLNLATARVPGDGVQPILFQAVLYDATGRVSSISNKAVLSAP